jgi:predicted CopG family antitoxin
MAVKTITIDLEAYEILSRYKDGRKSFSEVIKSELGRRSRGRDLRRVIEKLRMGEDAIDAIDAQIRKRRRERARTPKL